MRIEDRVAQQLGGLGAKAILCGSIDMGEANNGLRIFSVQSPQGSEQSKKFVVKASLRKVEGQISGMLESCTDKMLLSYDIPAPRIYYTSEGSEVWYICQEFLDGTNIRNIRGADLNYKVAEAAYRFSRGVGLLYQDFSRELKPVTIFGADLISRIERLPDRNLTSEVARKVKRVRSALGNHQNVICHNDIAWPNMSLQGSESGDWKVTLIDFGMVGWNFVGADLHHFAAASLGEGEGESYFEDLAEHTARFYGMSREVIKISAYYYAANRHALRSMRRGNSVEGIRRCISLLNRAIREIKRRTSA